MATFASSPCLRRAAASTRWQASFPPQPSLPNQPQRRAFSSTQCLCKRKAHSLKNVKYTDPARNNPSRGLSALKRSGLPRWKTLLVANEPVPKPRLFDRFEQIETRKDHGLWGFFNKDRSCLSKPEDDAAYGRAWTADELRYKGWEDLHQLWWVCVRDRNRLATEQGERERLQPGFGRREADLRDETVRTTMHAIRWVLIERWYAFEDAVKLSKTDPEINWEDEHGEMYSANSGEEWDEEGEGEGEMETQEQSEALRR